MLTTSSHHHFNQVLTSVDIRQDLAEKTLRNTQRKRERGKGRQLVDPILVSPEGKSTMALKGDKKKVEQLKKELKAKDTTIEKVNKELLVLRSTNEELSNTNNVQLEDIEGLKSDVSRLTEGNKDLEAKLVDHKTMVTQYENLQKDFDKNRNELIETQKQLEAFQSDNGPPANGAFTHTAKDYNDLVERNRRLGRKNSELGIRIAKVEDCLKQAIKACKKAGVSAKFERHDDVCKHLAVYIKEPGYRKFKFVKGDEATKKFLQACYDYVTKELPSMKNSADKDDYCPFDEFERIYEPFCQGTLATRRQYSQSSMVKSLVRKSNLVLTVSIFPFRDLTQALFHLRFLQGAQLYPHH
jgi:myosin heavy subunit